MNIPRKYIDKSRFPGEAKIAEEREAKQFKPSPELLKVAERRSEEFVRRYQQGQARPADSRTWIWTLTDLVRMVYLQGVVDGADAELANQRAAQEHSEKGG